jgi:hypothetical protein
VVWAGLYSGQRLDGDLSCTGNQARCLSCMPPGRAIHDGSIIPAELGPQLVADLRERNSARQCQPFLAVLTSCVFRAPHKLRPSTRKRETAPKASHCDELRSAFSRRDFLIGTDGRARCENMEILVLILRCLLFRNVAIPSRWFRTQPMGRST